jgi:hypothetical protein
VFESTCRVFRSLNLDDGRLQTITTIVRDLGVEKDITRATIPLGLFGKRLEVAGFSAMEKRDIIKALGGSGGVR